jgi:Flp pilus assembly protein TadG
VMRRAVSGGRDRGATDAIGLVLLAPAMIGLAVLVLALGGRVDDRARFRSAAAAAAQAAALERNPADARRAARRVVGVMLEPEDRCDRPSVSFPVSAESGVGTSLGTVTVVLRCRLAGSTSVGQPARTERFEASAGVDLFRERR